MVDQNERIGNCISLARERRMFQISEGKVQRTLNHTGKTNQVALANGGMGEEKGTVHPVIQGIIRSIRRNSPLLLLLLLTKIHPSRKPKKKRHGEEGTDSNGGDGKRKLTF